MLRGRRRGRVVGPTAAGEAWQPDGAVARPLRPARNRAAGHARRLDDADRGPGEGHEAVLVDLVEGVHLVEQVAGRGQELHDRHTLGVVERAVGGGLAPKASGASIIERCTLLGVERVEAPLSSSGGMRLVNHQRGVGSRSVDLELAPSSSSTLAGGVLEVDLEDHAAELVAGAPRCRRQPGAAGHVAALEQEHQPVGPLARPGWAAQ